MSTSVINYSVGTALMHTYNKLKWTEAPTRLLFFFITVLKSFKVGGMEKVATQTSQDECNKYDKQQS